MHFGIKSQQNSGLQALASRAGANITGAIQNAAARTGVDFSYLMHQANVESSFKPTAKASTSSATGLYQFTEGTWMQMVKAHGADHGLGAYADKITDSGKAVSKAARQQILALRNDPKLSSLMAAEYAADNKQYLQSTVGGEIGSTELYMAHFMGPGGAAKFLNKMHENPSAPAAKTFSKEACSNENIFYKDNGKARSLSEIYAVFDKKFDGASGGAATQVASTNKNQSVRDMDAASYSKYAAKHYNKSYQTAGLTSNDIFDEKTGTWSSYAGRSAAHMAALSPTSTGDIRGLQTRLSNPIDVMTLVDMQRDAHKDDNRYNA